MNPATLRRDGRSLDFKRAEKNFRDPPPFVSSSRCYGKTHDNFLIDHFVASASVLQRVLRESKIGAVIAVDEELLPPVQEHLGQRGAAARLAQLTVEADVDLGEILDTEEDAGGVLGPQQR